MPVVHFYAAAPVHFYAAVDTSIATHGLLENLVVRMDGPPDAGAYAVIAGGRRLAAMKALAEDGTIDADHPVPCLVAVDPAMTGELSLAENIVRIAMHPADQVVAFSKLTDAGLSVAAIAARFGTSERLVEQRLRLGNVGAGPARRLPRPRDRPRSAEGLLRHARPCPPDGRLGTGRGAGLPALRVAGEAAAHRGTDPGHLGGRALRRRRAL